MSRPVAAGADIAETRFTFVKHANLEGFARCALVEAEPLTGRTHQIRIHLSERGHPLVGETVYNREFYRADLPQISAQRLMLHAALLGFPHPVTGAPIQLRTPPPDDFLTVLESLGG